TFAERGEFVGRVAQDDAPPLVLAVGEKQIALLGIARECNVPHRAGRERVPGVKRLLHERTVRPEYLNAIVGAVAHIDQPVVRAFDAMYRVAELLSGWRLRIVWPEIGIVRLVAVRAPVTLHPTGVGAEHSHSLVEIAVSDVSLVRFRVDPD